MVLNIFIKNELKIFVAFIFFILMILKIECIPNFKTFYDSYNSYYIITSEGIKYNKNNSFFDIKSFEYNQKILFENETEIVSYGKFKDYPNIADLIIVKNYVYAVTGKNYFCSSQIITSGYSCEVYPFKCPTFSFCYFIIGCINSNKGLILYLYKNPSDNCASQLLNQTIIKRNITSENFSCQIIKSNSSEDVFVCFYSSFNKNIISLKAIIADIFYVDIANTNIFFNHTLITYLETEPIIIKSTLNQNRTKSYVCYINEKNYCECLIYDINNGFTSLGNFLNNCLISISSLYLYYYDISNEYYLYCYQSSTKFNLIKLNGNFSIINDNLSGIYEFYENFKECTEYYLSSLLYNSFNLTIFGNCNNSISEYQINENVLVIKTPSTTIIYPILTTLISTSQITETSTSISPSTDFIKSEFILISSSLDFIKTDSTLIFPSTDFTKPESLTLNLSTSTLFTNFISTNKINLLTSYIYDINNSSINLLQSIIIKDLNIDNGNELIIITKNSNKTKDEMINNIDEIIKDIDIGKIYEIYGNDYNAKISPINSKDYKNLPTYVEFLSCENKIRDLYHLSKDDILTIFQIEIYKNKSNSLVNQVEYTVFDEQKKQLDLSVCSDELIKIHYKILNSSTLNLSSISYYSNLNIDILNIKDKFFNDICYSYSEGGSDIIIKDRINDIYQNYSLCDSNCEYENMDIDNMTITCNCEVKNNISKEIEEPTFNIVVYDIFKYSTFKVIKCYNLVFNLNKKNNIGFWIFLISAIFHVPFIFYYFIFGHISIINNTKNEMIKYNYINKKNHPIKKNFCSKKIKKSKKKKINSTKNLKLKLSSKNLLLNSKNSKSSLKILNNISTNNLVKKINKGKKKKIKNNFNIKSKRSKSSKLLKNKSYLLTSINDNNNLYMKKNNTINKNKKICFSPLYTIINFDAGNKSKNKEIIVKYDLYTYDLSDAIKYERRKFCQIFFVTIILKEKIINTLFFKSPLEIQSLRICLLIFIYSCNFALNTLFYFSDKISDKYHYKQDNFLWFTIINNISISLISTILSSMIVSLLKFLINSKNEIIKYFRNEEIKMRSNKKYIVKKARKKLIQLQLAKEFRILKIKNFLFIFIEFIILLFFFYFTTAFCEVYKNTQKPWIIDCFISLILSIFVELLLAFIIAILYSFSIKKEMQCLYRLTLFIL